MQRTYILDVRIPGQKPQRRDVQARSWLEAIARAIPGFPAGALISVREIRT